MSERRIRAGLLLAPGAGADRHQPTLVAIDEALAGDGFRTVRMDFPYRRAGRRAPDPAPVLIRSVEEEAAALVEGARLRPSDLFLGGRSLGARMCSMAVAAGLPARGLVLISYPLHPPGRPDRARTEHFPSLRVACLFVSGTRDAFGSPEELEAVTREIPGPVSHHWIDGKDHGLRGADAEVVAAARSWLIRRRPRG